MQLFPSISLQIVTHVCHYHKPSLSRVNMTSYRLLWTAILSPWIPLSHHGYHWTWQRCEVLVALTKLLSFKRNTTRRVNMSCKIALYMVWKHAMGMFNIMIVCLFIADALVLLHMLQKLHMFAFIINLVPQGLIWSVTGCFELHFVTIAAVESPGQRCERYKPLLQSHCVSNGTQ